ncbi:hypothetical protein CDAR_444511 [Caerostris darwini]|uniref:Uncharacterized protein n=1 Tax=Caerostris darwini TaxID=1538125 RepID=A0AAV4UL12_9ARAC|nr:hypothetical protein CDAR_444511 [Caerostris darwini]
MCLSNSQTRFVHGFHCYDNKTKKKEKKTLTVSFSPPQGHPSEAGKPAPFPGKNPGLRRSSPSPITMASSHTTASTRTGPVPANPRRTGARIPEKGPLQTTWCRDGKSGPSL